MSVHDNDLAVHFNLDGTLGATFKSTAAGITDGEYHRVCVSWNSVGGVVDLYYGDSEFLFSLGFLFYYRLSIYSSPHDSKLFTPST